MDGNQAPTVTNNIAYTINTNIVVLCGFMIRKNIIIRVPEQNYQTVFEGAAGHGDAMSQAKHVLLANLLYFLCQLIIHPAKNR
jgi:hypothetical protein